MYIQGPRDIYLGISGAVFGTIPTAFLYFSTYEWCKERLSERGHSQVRPVTPDPLPTGAGGLPRSVLARALSPPPRHAHACTT